MNFKYFAVSIAVFIVAVIAKIESSFDSSFENVTGKIIFPNISALSIFVCVFLETVKTTQVNASNITQAKKGISSIN